jgi:ribosomal-protein-alanine N-acetyltransferase
LQAQEQLIGFCGFRYFYQPDQSRQVELLYGLAPTDWGQGLATEAARAVLNYAFRTQLFRRVYARTDEPNHASVGVLRRLGMKFEAKLSLDGRPTLSYCLSADDFPLQPERLRIVAHD